MQISHDLVPDDDEVQSIISGGLTARDIAAIEMARMGRLKLRNAAKRRGHSIATASAMADVFENMLHEHMSASLAVPLSGIKP